MLSNDFISSDNMASDIVTTKNTHKQDSNNSSNNATNDKNNSNLSNVSNLAQLNPTVPPKDNLLHNIQSGGLLGAYDCEKDELKLFGEIGIFCVIILLCIISYYHPTFSVTAFTTCGYTYWPRPISCPTNSPRAPSLTLSADTTILPIASLLLKNTTYLQPYNAPNSKKHKIDAISQDSIATQLFSDQNQRKMAADEGEIMKKELNNTIQRYINKNKIKFDDKQRQLVDVMVHIACVQAQQTANFECIRLNLLQRYILKTLVWLEHSLQYDISQNIQNIGSINNNIIQNNDKIESKNNNDNPNTGSNIAVPKFISNKAVRLVKDLKPIFIAIAGDPEAIECGIISGATTQAMNDFTQMLHYSNDLGLSSYLDPSMVPGIKLNNYEPIWFAMGRPGVKRKDGYKVSPHSNPSQRNKVDLIIVEAGDDLETPFREFERADTRAQRMPQIQKWLQERQMKLLPCNLIIGLIFPKKMWLGNALFFLNQVIQSGFVNDIEHASLVRMYWAGFKTLDMQIINEDDRQQINPHSVVNKKWPENTLVYIDAANATSFVPQIGPQTKAIGSYCPVILFGFSVKTS